LERNFTTVGLTQYSVYNWFHYACSGVVAIEEAVLVAKGLDLAVGEGVHDFNFLKE